MEDPYYFETWIQVAFFVSICLSAILTLITVGIIYDTFSEFRLFSKFRYADGWKINKWGLFGPSAFLTTLTAGSFWLTTYFGSLYSKQWEKLNNEYAYMVEFDVTNALTFKVATNKEPVIQNGTLLWTLPDGTEVKTACFKIRKNNYGKPDTTNND